MSDAFENANGLDPNDSADAWRDPDGDDAINLFEYQLGADPNNASTPPIVTLGASGADFTDAETALDTVAAGTCIRVAGGLYNLNYIGFDPLEVMVQGGWNSTFTSRDLTQNITTFDGQLQDRIIRISVSSGNPVVILDGIELVRGSGFMGAIWLLADGTANYTKSIVNCTFYE